MDRWVDRAILSVALALLGWGYLLLRWGLGYE